MASGFFALFDDIAVLMDDVAVVSKVATKKTAGILGDDLAVSAEKASGFASSRELPVLWAISKGSLINKFIILPFAFLLSAYMAWIITPILVLGGIYLAYEAVEKIYEHFASHETEKKPRNLKPMSKEEILEEEKDKIKSAIFTDFILSIEIVIIALSATTDHSLPVQIIVVSFVSILATVGVYGIVALIVRMDDIGFRLIAFGDKHNKVIFNKMGRILIRALPIVIKSLGIIGTIAMLLVAGGIFLHNIHQLHKLTDLIMPNIILELLLGFLVGAIAIAVLKIFNFFKTSKV